MRFEAKENHDFIHFKIISHGNILKSISSLEKKLKPPEKNTQDYFKG